MVVVKMLMLVKCVARKFNIDVCFYFEEKCYNRNLGYDNSKL